jgi:hypothetical protein
MGPKWFLLGGLVSLSDIPAFITHNIRSFPDLFKWREKTVKDSRINGYAITNAGRRMLIEI